MSVVTIPVEIRDGRVTPVEPHTLPDRARGLLLLTNEQGGVANGRFVVDRGQDGLPVIRAEGVITSEMVREIEGVTR